MHGPAPWIDEALVEAERARLPEGSFRRLWLNEWTDVGDDPLCDRDSLEACCRVASPLAPRPGVEYVVGLDVGLRNDRTAIVVGHRETVDAEPVIVVDKVELFVPPQRGEVDLRHVRDRVVEVAREYRAEVRADRWQAAQLLQDARARGVRCGEVEMGQGPLTGRALALRQLLAEGRLLLPDDPVVFDEFLGARLVERGTGWRVDHAHGHHDDIVCAVSYVVERLLGRRDPSSVLVGPGGGTRRAPFGDRVDLTVLR